MYLDHNATTPLAAAALDAMLPYLREHYGNPSSVHRAGRAARLAIEDAREQVAALVSAAPGQVVFTSGGSEANNLALKGILAQARPDAALLTSEIEHSSVAAVAAHAAQMGRQVVYVAPNADGVVEPEAVIAALPRQVALVSIMLVNNESGVIQPVAKLAGLLRERDIAMHTDAVQAAGKMALDFERLGVNLLSMSAHKFYGPKGIGALIVGRQVKLEALLHGGSHERQRRAGTENVAGIVGFGVAANLVRQELEAEQARLTGLRERLLREIRARIGDAVIYGEQAERVPNTVLLGIPEVEGEKLLMNLDLAGIMVSSGAACASGSLAPSPTLLAMGVARAEARNAIRISLGKANTEDEMKCFVDELARQVERLRAIH